MRPEGGAGPFAVRDGPGGSDGAVRLRGTLRGGRAPRRSGRASEGAPEPSAGGGDLRAGDVRAGKSTSGFKSFFLIIVFS